MKIANFGKLLIKNVLKTKNMEVEVLLSTSPPAQEDKTHNISAFSKVACCDAYKIDTSDSESKRILQMYCITIQLTSLSIIAVLVLHLPMYYNVFICIVC